MISKNGWLHAKIKSFEEGASRQGTSQKQVKIVTISSVSFIDDAGTEHALGQPEQLGTNSFVHPASP